MRCGRRRRAHTHKRAECSTADYVIPEKVCRCGHERQRLQPRALATDWIRVGAVDRCVHHGGEADEVASCRTTKPAESIAVNPVAICVVTNIADSAFHILDGFGIAEYGGATVVDG